MLYLATTLLPALGETELEAPEYRGVDDETKDARGNAGGNTSVGQFNDAGSGPVTFRGVDDETKDARGVGSWGNSGLSPNGNGFGANIWQNEAMWNAGSEQQRGVNDESKDARGNAGGNTSVGQFNDAGSGPVTFRGVGSWGNSGLSPHGNGFGANIWQNEAMWNAGSEQQRGVNDEWKDARGNAGGNTSVGQFNDAGSGAVTFRKVHDAWMKAARGNAGGNTSVGQFNDSGSGPVTFRAVNDQRKRARGNAGGNTSVGQFNDAGSGAVTFREVHDAILRAARGRSAETKDARFGHSGYLSQNALLTGGGR